MKTGAITKPDRARAVARGTAAVGALMIFSTLIVLPARAQPESSFAQPQKKPEPPQRRAAKSQANICAQFGPGFVRAEGADTCVKIGGGVGIGVGGGPGSGR